MSVQILVANEIDWDALRLMKEPHLKVSQSLEHCLERESR